MTPLRPKPKSPMLLGRLAPNRAGAYCQKFVLETLSVLPGME